MFKKKGKNSEEVDWREKIFKRNVENNVEIKD